jgi:hypothetical protein
MFGHPQVVRNQHTAAFGCYRQDVRIHHPIWYHAQGQAIVD